MPERRPDREERERQILAAALAAFAENGFAATRLDDVARRAGVAKGTIYLYFDSKERLFEAMVRSAMLPHIEAAEAMAGKATTSVVQVLRAVMRHLARELIGTERRHIIRLVVAEGPRFPELLAFYHHTVVARAFALVRGLAARGIASGELRPDTLDRFPQLLAAPLVLGALWKTLFEPFDPLDLEAMLDTHIDILMHGAGRRT